MAAQCELSGHFYRRNGRLMPAAHQAHGQAFQREFVGFRIDLDDLEVRVFRQRLTVTSLPMRTTTIWPFLALSTFFTASKSPSMMPASRIDSPRTLSR